MRRATTRRNGRRASVDGSRETRRRKRRKGIKEKKDAQGNEGRAAGGEAPPPPQDPVEAGPAGSTPIPTPRFVSEAYFMDFKFEAGNYYLVGREPLEGQTVLRIEYYPTRMFNDNDDDERRGRQREPRRENQREREIEQRSRAADEQDRARHALGRSRRAPDREIHVRQRLDGFPARRLAGQSRRHQGVDDDGPAVSGRGCRAR